jgi:hypothetical protein
MRVLAFDIGIRNLAWCLGERETTDVSGVTTTCWTIHGWENYDLLAGMTTQDAKTAAKILCGVGGCGKKATHVQGATAPPTCAKHSPAAYPPLKDASGALVKKLPALKGLRALLPSQKGLKTKADVLTAISQRWSLPYSPPKANRRAQEDLVRIHDSLRKFVKTNAEIFRTATHILLENQPAFKNPTMKSVQILLFATLRDILEKEGQFVGFVHAGKKVKGAETGDKGYAARKKGSEERVAEFLEKEPVANRLVWKQFLASQQKTADLCDALCMVMDRTGSA